ncbi:MAG: hypothetical protein NTZ95_01900 [Candidatus Omnitrophica bacterium]|nr:hypothetical protein [Candidatus Omnitrophota bacterium]
MPGLVANKLLTGNPSAKNDIKECRDEIEKVKESIKAIELYIKKLERSGCAGLSRLIKQGYIKLSKSVSPENPEEKIDFDLLFQEHPEQAAMLWEAVISQAAKEAKEKWPEVMESLIDEKTEKLDDFKLSLLGQLLSNGKFGEAFSNREIDGNFFASLGIGWNSSMKFDRMGSRMRAAQKKLEAEGKKLTRANWIGELFGDGIPAAAKAVQDSNTSYKNWNSSYKELYDDRWGRNETGGLQVLRAAQQRYLARVSSIQGKKDLNTMLFTGLLTLKAIGVNIQEKLGKLSERPVSENAAVPEAAVARPVSNEELKAKDVSLVGWSIQAARFSEKEKQRIDSSARKLYSAMKVKAPATRDGRIGFFVYLSQKNIRGYNAKDLISHIDRMTKRAGEMKGKKVPELFGRMWFGYSQNDPGYASSLGFLDFLEAYNEYMVRNGWASVAQAGKLASSAASAILAAYKRGDMGYLKGVESLVDEYGLINKDKNFWDNGMAWARRFVEKMLGRTFSTNPSNVMDRNTLAGPWTYAVLHLSDMEAAEVDKLFGETVAPLVRTAGNIPGIEPEDKYLKFLKNMSEGISSDTRFNDAERKAIASYLEKWIPNYIERRDKEARPIDKTLKFVTVAVDRARAKAVAAKTPLTAEAVKTELEALDKIVAKVNSLKDLPVGTDMYRTVLGTFKETSREGVMKGEYKLLIFDSQDLPNNNWNLIESRNFVPPPVAPEKLNEGLEKLKNLLGGIFITPLIAAAGEAAESVKGAPAEDWIAIIQGYNEKGEWSRSEALLQEMLIQVRTRISAGQLGPEALAAVENCLADVRANMKARLSETRTVRGKPAANGTIREKTYNSSGVLVDDTTLNRAVMGNYTITLPNGKKIELKGVWRTPFLSRNAAGKETAKGYMYSSGKALEGLIAKECTIPEKPAGNEFAIKHGGAVLIEYETVAGNAMWKTIYYADGTTITMDRRNNKKIVDYGNGDIEITAYRGDTKNEASILSFRQLKERDIRYFRFSGQ